MFNEITNKKSSPYFSCSPCDAIIETAKKIINAIATNIDALAACIFRNCIYYIPINRRKTHEIDLLFKSIKELNASTENDKNINIPHLDSLSCLIPRTVYFSKEFAVPIHIDNAIEEKKGQLLAALKTHYCTVKGIWEGVANDQNLFALYEELTRLCQAKKLAAEKTLLTSVELDSPNLVKDTTKTTVHPLPTQTAKVTQEDVRPPVEKNKEKLKQFEFQEISKAISELTDLPENTTGMEDLETLQKILPGYLAVQKFPTPEDLELAIKQKKAQLITALKTHQTTIKSLEEIQINGETLELKSDLGRFYDIKRTRINPGIRPKNVTLLPLTPKAEKADWPNPKELKPIEHFPAHIFFFPHAVEGSDEANNYGYPDEKLAYNVDNPWAIALEFAEENILPRPLEKMNVEELKQAVKELHKRLSDEPNEQYRDQEIMIFKTGKLGTFNYLARSLKDSDPQTSKALMEMNKIAQRWGCIEASRPYYETKHWNSFNKIAHLTSAPEQIDELFTEFCLKLKEIMDSGTYHPYQVAAFIHNGLTEIHLFGDCNGRLARLMANIYLMQQGFQPLVVLDDRIYTDAANAPWDKYEQAFTDYLHESLAEIHKRVESQELPTEKTGAAWDLNSHPDATCAVQ
jgi:Fic/DOC family